ncbi:MAG: hypothetical protein CL762_00150 [Chloroflexi bacterium]|nr:hypothetical protein [Chloroflexota bacterium]
MNTNNFYIRIFNKEDQLDVQNMVVNGLIYTAKDRPDNVKTGISAYINRSIEEDLGNIYDHYFPTGVFFVAMSCSNVIASLGAEKESHSTFRLKRLSVKMDYRNQGIAGELLNNVEKWTHERGATKLILGTSEVQKDALRFWRKSGFKVTQSEIVESGIEVFSLMKNLNLNFNDG